MRIVIDLQGAQGASRNRGIGRYSLHFVQSLARLGTEHEIFIALNAAFADTIDPIRAALEGLVPQERIVVWEAPGTLAGIDPATSTRRRAAERIREAFLASLRPDWVLVTSMVEGFPLGNDPNNLTSLHQYSLVPTAAILFDLIPLIYPDTYLSNSARQNWYFEKIGHLRRASLLLAISESSKREAVEHLGFDPAAVVAIGTDCDVRFQPGHISAAQSNHLQTAYNIKRQFVLSFAGPNPDWRKNLDRLIAAYGLLPDGLRHDLQLVIVTSMQAGENERLLDLARKAGLVVSELVLTGYVPEEDLVALYNACTLFVFPSWHEGFGLPVLEAMRCGKAVLAANVSSLPEVVGREDALFDPFNERAIAGLIERTLIDDAFRHDLEGHSLAQNKKFSWEQTARKALSALEAAARSGSALPALPASALRQRRPRLAYVSPLPPEKSGIADYSAEFLPELTRWYEVDVIVAQPEVTDAYIRANCPIRSVDEFRARADRYDRVLYHFGNSLFHAHMFVLLDDIPGVVVLHDFFLSGFLAHEELHGKAPHAWARSLLNSHGYRAVVDRFTANDKGEVVWRYPANLSVLQGALGVIVHSEFSRRLANQWYGDQASAELAVIPHLRARASAEGPEAARQALRLASDDLLVCSFGLLAPTKLNHRLLEAWLASPLAHDPKAHLVFVGENHGGDYGQNLLRLIQESPAPERIRITGWADAETYRRFLAAADIGVQLRTLSRGESSGTVLDCMNHGLATICNAHGSMEDLDRDGVWVLPDAFSDAELIEALTTLAGDGHRRRRLGAYAREIIRTRHAPARCATQYFDAIERFYSVVEEGMPTLLTDLVKQPLREEEWPLLATSIARNFPPAPRRRQLLVDVSALVFTDLKTGVERVVRSILREWLHHPPDGFHVEPVYATMEALGYRYARRWTSRFLGIPDDWAEDAQVEAWPGDVFVGLDLNPHLVPAKHSFLRGWYSRGVKVWFVVYDLLPVLLPQVFPEEAQATHQRWLETISQFDGAVCISKAVKDELADWLATFGPRRERPLAISWFHLGADVQRSVPTTGLPPEAGRVLMQLSSRPSFLMVGTIEPRKGYLQVIAAFEQLWGSGIDINLVIVGKEGWKALPERHRRDIPETVERLRQHPERSKRLFWLEGISDEYLEKVYAAATCLIAASYGEGFGLPLIEAAQHKLPLIARNIPVFHEVAAGDAHYFEDTRDPAVIAELIGTWLTSHESRATPMSPGMNYLTWKESAQHLLDIVLGAITPTHSWLPEVAMRWWGSDPRLSTAVGTRDGRKMRTTGQSGYLICGPYSSTPAGTYHLVIHGSISRLSGNEVLDISCNKGQKIIACQALRSKATESWVNELRFSLEHSTSDFEIRIFVADNTIICIDNILLEKTNSTISRASLAQIIDSEDELNKAGKSSFSYVNVSHRKDLYWSELLYKSLEKNSQTAEIFYIVTPTRDILFFETAINNIIIKNGGSKNTPILLSEELVLKKAGVRDAKDLSGWLIQQILKLEFSKLSLSDVYVTIDSATVFTKEFNPHHIFFKGELPLTCAREYNRINQSSNYRKTGESGWLNNQLVNISECFEAIENFFQNTSETAYHHIGELNIFSSKFLLQLDALANNEGFGGLHGLIRYIPLEPAWYGSYVANFCKTSFHPVDPDYTICCNTDALVLAANNGEVQVPDDLYGIRFQAPAIEHANLELLQKYYFEGASRDAAKKPAIQSFA